MKIIKPILQTLFLLLADQAYAQIQLPWLLSDGAVLQRNEPIPIWGTAPAGSTVHVVFAGDKRDVQADNQGNWETVFPARKSGGPFEIQISSGEFSTRVKDILIGDVWICSGQSNMEWTVRESGGAADEIAAADSPHIRHFKIPRSWAVEPADTLAGGAWRPATAENLGDFTAVGWYFGKRIYSETHIPIGLINATWGGSRIEAWMSPDALGMSASATQTALNTLVSRGEARAQKVKRLLQKWPGSLVEQLNSADADWSMPQLDEHDWEKIQVPGLWEAQQFAGVDGVLWYRKTFELTQAQADGGITLGLGRIDDNDITWVNGHKVGATNAYDQVRTYTVPAKYLKAGKNQLAVRVVDTGGGGGIYSSEDLLYWQAAEDNRQSLAGEWKIKADKVTVAIQDNMHHTATALYNKMLYPLFKIPVKGVLWYQGESNANTAQEAEAYRQQFPAMIKDWRARWRAPELPFYWVQLANFISGVDTENASPWAILRESQTAALALDHTGQVITIDVGNPNDIHPTDKQTVGNRLALIALHKTYEKRRVKFRGPVFQKAKRKNNELILTFESSGKLVSEEEGSSIKGFEIADADGQFTAIDGVIRKNRVVLPLHQINKATAVRYAWSDNPEHANLMDATGLPAEPFRTDL